MSISELTDYKPFPQNPPNNKIDNQTTSKTRHTEPSDTPLTTRTGTGSINISDSASTNPIKNNNIIKAQNMQIKQKQLHKPKYAIFTDYIIDGFVLLLYYAINNYMTVHAQCIPPQSNSSKCGHKFNYETPYIGYPHLPSTFAVYMPYLYGFLNYIAVILISLFIHKPSLQEFRAIFWKIECLWRETMTAVIFTQTTVGFIKKFVGRPRPNFRNYDNDNDRRESFVSGHASSSFCIHCILLAHIVYSMHWAHFKYEMNGVNQQKRAVMSGASSQFHERSNEMIVEKHNSLLNQHNSAGNVHNLFCGKLWVFCENLNVLKMVVLMGCLVLPIWISLSRIVDYWHNYSDVIGGALIGCSIGSLTFVLFHNELYPNSISNNHYRSKSQMSDPLLG